MRRIIKKSMPLENFIHIYFFQRHSSFLVWFSASSLDQINFTRERETEVFHHKHPDFWQVPPYMQHGVSARLQEPPIRAKNFSKILNKKERKTFSEKLWLKLKPFLTIIQYWNAFILSMKWLKDFLKYAFKFIKKFEI